VLAEQLHQLAAEGKIFVVDQQRVLGQQFRVNGIKGQPTAGARYQHAQRVAEQRQCRQTAVLLHGQGGHRQIQLAVDHRLLDG